MIHALQRRTLEAIEYLSNEELVCRANVNYAISHMAGRNKTIIVVLTLEYMFQGTICATHSGRRYSRLFCLSTSMCYLVADAVQVISLPKVTQVVIIPVHAIALAISDNMLLAFQLKILHPQITSDGACTASQKLSGERNVRFLY
jgi:hypothetical protein